MVDVADMCNMANVYTTLNTKLINFVVLPEFLSTVKLLELSTS